ncbi:MAG: YicC family protein [Pyrinomonadaceae bacterium]|nr:YicC family protein [Pyrinomonadaceae bacterium]
MRSMTGFGRGSASNDKTNATVELKTVNNRFLDVNIKLPSDLQHLEAALKRSIIARLGRGRVDVNLQIERTEDVIYEVNRGLISGFLNAMSELKSEFNLAGEPDVNVIARIPNIISAKRAEMTDEVESAVQNAIERALDDLEKMRSTEGALLGHELEDRLAGIEGRLVPIEASAAEVADEFAERLKKRIDSILEKLGTAAEPDPGRLAQEIAYLADRVDISEEIARLKAHIDHFRQIMKEEKDVGKRLDFLTQELNREANTITSKTNNLTIKENALAIKSEIEKIREQVQNVE